MATPRFVHLHLHTDYSLLDGACDITELVNEAAHRGMPAVAVTDHGNLFAAEHFHHEASTRGVKPIIGCEVYVARTSRHDRGGERTNGDTNAVGGRNGRAAGGGNGQSSVQAGGQAGEVAGRGTNHLVLLCENAEGYRNLIHLVSAGFLEGFYYKPRIDYDLLAKHSRGLIALSACLSGAVAEPLIEGRFDDARDAAYRLRDIFGKSNFFLEVQDQGLEIDQPVNRELVRLSRESGIPLVATNDCHYLTREDSRAQEVLLCIQTGKTMSDPQRMRFATDQFYFKTAEEMAQVFRELPDALERTAAIAERCNVRIEPVRNSFPEFQVPQGHTADSFFERVAREGFNERVPLLEKFARQGWLRRPLAEYEQRLNNEIKMIVKMRYSGYFLIVWDFMRYARAQGIPVGPGRGSAAGSLVSYALKITDVDPLQYDLLFERFLNPERVSMPDIDIDFCMRRRGEVIDYVTQKYGRGNVAQIITFGTMAAKAALKDVGRALDLPYGDVDKLAKLVPNQINISLEEALKQSGQLRSAIESDERFKDLLEVAKRLEGLARHASTHAAGVVISPQPLTELLPVYKTNRDEITTQYDMKGLERLGLLKMDFLGLTTLTVLSDAVKLIAANRGAHVDLDTLGLDDAETYQLFARADTTAIFQFESHGMRDILRRYQPSRLEDLTALNALYRPGPIQGGMIDDFIARKLGKKKASATKGGVDLVHELPELKDILEETYGVILYQEQVMQIANRLAGFSMGEADILRRAMGKKNRDEMAAQREKFLTGCAVHKVPPKKAERIFDLMAEFAGYGFNKSHSCAYALLAYQTAWLKTHYAVEFMAALLTSETGNTEKVVKYIHEAKGMGITVLPPDVNTSSVDFTPVGEQIRFGLRAIKNVGENTVLGILEAREKLGKFRSMFQLCDSVDPRLLNRRVLESLVKAGALDSLRARRAQLYAVIDRAMERGQKIQRDTASTQHGLIFGGAAAHEPPEPELPDAEEWPEYELLANEFATLGFYISGHPLDKYSARLKELKAVELAAIEGRRDGEDVAIGAMVSALRPKSSREGNRWAILDLQDMTGQLEARIFSEAFGRFEPLLKSGVPLLMRGRIKVEDAGTSLNIREVCPLDGIAGAPSVGPQIRVRIELSAMDEMTLDQIKTVLAGSPGPCAIAFDIFDAGGDMATLASNQRVRIDERLVSRLQEMPGVGSVEVVR